jgi:hypothetical protein
MKAKRHKRNRGARREERKEKRKKRAEEEKKVEVKMKISFGAYTTKSHVTSFQVNIETVSTSWRIREKAQIEREGLVFI